MTNETNLANMVGGTSETLRDGYSRHNAQRMHLVMLRGAVQAQNTTPIREHGSVHLLLCLPLQTSISAAPRTTKHNVGRTHDREQMAAVLGPEKE